MIKVSSNPLVVIRPTRAPRRWIRALVDTVVPCAKRSVSASNWWSSIPAERASLAITSSLRGKPLPKGFIAFGEVGLAGEVRPAGDVPLPFTYESHRS